MVLFAGDNAKQVSSTPPKSRKRLLKRPTIDGLSQSFPSVAPFCGSARGATKKVTPPSPSLQSRLIQPTARRRPDAGAAGAGEVI